MEFKEYAQQFHAHIKKMTAGEKHLFVVDLPADLVWDTYLSSFAPGDNSIFRERTEHDCSCCRHLIRDLGRVVAIKDDKITTAWSFTAEGKYKPVVKALAKLVKEAPIKGVFVPETHNFGTKRSREMTPDGEVIVWNHLHCTLGNTVQTAPRHSSPL